MAEGRLAGHARLCNLVHPGNRQPIQGKIARRPQEKVRVLICGEPYSGNRMLNTTLGMLGCAATIMHGIGDLPSTQPGRQHASWYQSNRERFELFSPTHAIMPVRSIPFQVASLRKHDPDGAIWKKDRNLMTWDVVRCVHDYHIPLKVISYEAFVQDPRAHVLWLADWMGIDKARAESIELGWIHDGNAKWRK